MKYIIETYGCQMNVADSELIGSILTKSGYTQTDDINLANIIIFNTCSVRENAEQRVIGRITSEVSRKIEKQNSLLIGVVGCMAQRLGEALAKINKKIDFVVGVDQYSQLPNVIENCFRNHDFVNNTTFNHSEIYNDLYPIRTNSINAFVTIMRGCNNFCTYCIVPFTRGRERSRPIDEIINEIELAGKNKIYEITLLGQNVNSYSFDGNDFPDLLKKINKIDSIKRIRFVTSHPKDLSDKLIDVMAKCEKVCEHIHLPLQSGNNDILEKMNRGYTAEHYLQLTQKLRNVMPNIAITTDVIAGFPSETEEQFKDTLDIMKEIQFDFAYMFKYSERSGTKAMEFRDSVPEEVRLNRLQKLIDQQTEITTAKYKQRIGATEEIYVESVSKRDSKEMSGKTRDFKITVFQGDESLINTFVNVKITDAAGWTLKGYIDHRTNGLPPSTVAVISDHHRTNGVPPSPVAVISDHHRTNGLPPSPVAVISDHHRTNGLPPLKISLIAAIDENNAIGYNNDLLIKIPQDLKHFKKLTTNNIVVMGRKTFESLPNKTPLKNRVNIVLTKDKNFTADGVEIYHSINEILTYSTVKEIFIIGGEMIYNLFLPYCTKAYITKIYKKFVADKYFPSLNNTWITTEKSEIFETENGVRYQFLEIEKRS